MPILESNIPVLHRSWTNATSIDSHGNKIGGLGAPVQRWVIAIYPASATLSRDDYMSPNVVARSETDIMVDVDDASIYHNQDQILIAGFAFDVQGEPALMGWDAMPIAGYADIVPSSVHCRRVT
jgi:hypothetical protein